MSEREDIDDATATLRQSVIEAKSNRHCLRDFSGEVFELTPDMLVSKNSFNPEEKSELAGVAECILHKYAKLLSIAK